MSLIQRIQTRRFEDLINQGYRLAVVGSQSGSGTDTVIQAGATERTIVITGFTLSTNNASDVLVSLGFKTGSNATATFAQAYIKTAAPYTYTFPIGDERYSSVGDGLVLTNSAGPVSYTIFGRIIGEKVALGYIEQLGVSAHLSPGSPINSSGFSSFWRGGWPA